MAKLRLSGNPEEYEPFSIFSDWFALEINKKRVFNVDSYHPKKKLFCNTHYDKNDNPINIDGVVIQTKLMAVIPNGDFTSPQVVYIWKVRKK